MGEQEQLGYHFTGRTTRFKLFIVIYIVEANLRQTGIETDLERILYPKGLVFPEGDGAGLR